MKMTLSIMILIRKGKVIMNVLREVIDDYFPINIPCIIYIFGNLTQNPNDPIQEGQDYQECHTSTESF